MVISNIANFTSFEVANCTVKYTALSTSEIKDINSSIAANLSKLTALAIFDVVFEKSPTEPDASWWMGDAKACCKTNFGPFAWSSMNKLNHLVPGYV